jgi:tetratricopeptide (TPR) repeat protein
MSDTTRLNNLPLSQLFFVSLINLKFQMKITLLVCCLVSFLAIGCAQSQDCPDGINKLPMYGNAKKCKEQIAYDNKFIAECEKSSTRKDAAAHMVKRGWEYLRKNELDTSMMRFNQAWLLDSLNSEVYWGFADNLGLQKKYKESIPFFERALKMSPNNAKTWADESTSYGNIFFETKDIKYLSSTISSLKQAVQLDPNNAQYYGQLTSAYCYYMQKDSARKYMKLADKLDSNAVNLQARKMLSK